jgi:hypothetical protein
VTGPPRDWDKELAEIDRLIAKQPVAGGAGPVAGSAGAAPPPARRAAAPEGSPPVRTGRTILTAWIRVLLGVVVAAGVARWPYTHACGAALYGYVAAAGGVAVVGLWGVATTWRRRMGLAHTLSLLVTLWGAVLVGKAVLERTGYVKVSSTWACP